MRTKTTWMNWALGVAESAAGPADGSTAHAGLLLGGVLDALRRGRIDELYVQTESLKLFDENVEAFRKARFEVVLPLDDGLVHARASLHVVAFDGEKLLKRVRGSVRLHGPDLHFPETLSPESGFPTERLLGDERVGADRTRVNLVVDQVMKLEHVHDADRDFLIEGVSGSTVEENGLAAGRA